MRSGPDHSPRIAELETRLAEAEDTLDAIRSGSIDALVVRTPRGEQLFTLKGADQTYRALVEAMNEGAVTLNRAIISYCNHHFARMARAPLERVIGSSILDLVRSTEFRKLLRDLQSGQRTRGSLETTLAVADAAQVPVLVSGCRFLSEDRVVIGLVFTDISERKEAERARRELSRRILNAQELERQRVARELHDGINQLLSSAKFRLSDLWQQERDQCRENALQALDLVQRAIAELRLISRNLRPSELDDLGLIPALRSLLQEFEKRAQIAARFRGPLQAALPGEVEMALYRIVQEALNNVGQHSGATQVEVTLRCARGVAQVTIQDNGRGLPKHSRSPHHRGWGLKNMRERASLLGGTFTLHNPTAGGTVLNISIPLQAESEEELNHEQKNHAAVGRRPRLGPPGHPLQPRPPSLDRDCRRGRQRQ